MRFRRFQPFMLGCFLLCALPVFALQYTVTGLGFFPGGSRGEAYAVNNLGQVVGCSYFADFSRHACLWSGGQVIDLGTLGGIYSEAWDINDSGQITGWASIGSNYRAFLWQNGSMANLGALNNAFRSKAYGINASGVVVGQSEPNMASSNWFPIRLSGGVMSSLGTFGGQWGEAHGINASGVTVGWAYDANNKERAFRWTPAGGLQDLGTLGGDKAFAYDINDNGVIVGTAYDAGDLNYAFVWQNGTMTALPGTIATAWAINNTGEIVGFRSGFPASACIWKNGVCYALNDCIPANSGWHLQQARDINDQGQIVGIGVYDNKFQAFLLTPVVNPYKPDMMIRNAGEAEYTGNNLYVLPEGQTKAQGTGVAAPAVYHVAVQNDGTVADTFTITAADAPDGWTVRFFDALTGGTEITAQVTDDGWSTGELAVAASRAIRVEVTPGAGLAFGAEAEIAVTAVSTDGVTFDTVQAITTKAALSAVALAASPAGSTLAGRPITLTATPTGGSNVEYRFFKVYNGVTTTIQPYTLNDNTCQLTPTELGQYQFIVWAREQGSATKYVSSLVHKVNPPLTAVNIAATPIWPQAPGTVITVKATPVNGGQIEYRFYKAEPGGALTIVQPYGTSNTYTFTPSVQGQYQFTVYAREVGSGVTKQAYANMTYNVATPITSVDLVADPASPQTAGTPVHLTATAHGGFSVQYRFFVITPAGQTVTLKNYAVGDNVCDYTPLTPGRYTFIVWVRETHSTRGKDAYKALTYTVQ